MAVRIGSHLRTITAVSLLRGRIDGRDRRWSDTCFRHLSGRPAIPVVSPPGVSSDGAHLWVSNETADGVSGIPTAAGVPTITEFTPTGGSARTVVTITGTDLSGTTKVTFNRVKGIITKDTDTTIVVEIPSRATTGKIQVVTPGRRVKTTTAFGVTNLTYSGVLTGRLVNTVSLCQPRPDAQSEITVNGSLNGTSWALLILSYDGQSGVWQVLTGQAGGGTGLDSPGYSVTATYPATVSGVMHTDWASGATIDVRLASGQGQVPAGNIEVKGAVACG